MFTTDRNTGSIFKRVLNITTDQRGNGFKWTGNLRAQSNELIFPGRNTVFSINKRLILISAK